MPRLGNIRLYQCPYTYISDDTWSILRVIFLCTNADGELTILPNKGGITDQFYWFIEAYEIYYRELLEHRKNGDKSN